MCLPLRCPVCKLSTGYYSDERPLQPLVFDLAPIPLYRMPGGGITERCSKCFDKARKKYDGRVSK